MQLISAIAPTRTEHVACQALAVHANQRRFVLINFAFDQGQMMLAVEFRTVQMQIEITVVGRHFNDLLRLYEFFAYAPMRDQTLDRTNAQAMLFAEFHQLRQPRHGTVVVQNFAEHSRRLESGHSCQIDGGLGVPGASQDTSVLRAQWKDMPGLVEIVGRRFRIRDCQDSSGPIVSADTRGHTTCGIYRNSKVCLMFLPVLRHHALQAELFSAFV